MQSTIKILVSCNENQKRVLQNETVTGIQLGCAAAQKRVENALYDDTGESLSTQHAVYGELTAQYWAFRNLEADYYGFCPCGSVFDFKAAAQPQAAAAESDAHSARPQAKNALPDDAAVRCAVEPYDIVTTPLLDVRKIAGDALTAEEYYARDGWLYAQDLHTAVEILQQLFPAYAEASRRYCKGHIIRTGGMYILKKALFQEYCGLLFAVLERFCAQTDMSRYSTKALRTPQYLAECLFDIYCLKVQAENPALKLHTLPAVPFCMIAQEMLQPAFEKDAVPVVFAANNGFVPVFAACLTSVLEHCCAQRNYDMVLLQTNVTKENQAVLQSLTQGRANVSLRIFDVSGLIENYNLKANEHISVETYYRFLIQEVLPGYDKILYLDCDLIANADVAELYDTDVEGYLLAAARDPDFLGQLNGANPTTPEYCAEAFPMKDPYGYFQAGVLLFNEKEMRKAYTLDEWLTFAAQPYRYNDQDVLNLHCEGRVRYLPMAWNLITDCNHTRVREVIVYAPDAVQREYRAAHAAPKLIHYAGFRKPWHRPGEDYGALFWQAAQKTPYYEELLYQMTRRAADEICAQENEKHGIAALKRALRHFPKKVRDALLPEGTARRKWLKRWKRRLQHKS